MTKLQRVRPVILTAVLVISLHALAYIDIDLQATSSSSHPVSRFVWQSHSPSILAASLPRLSNTTSTCQSYQNQGYSFTQAVVAGDSIMNWSTPETELLQQLTANGIAVSPAGFTYTISGSGNGALLSTLQSGVLDSDIASSDLFILNRGVNDWSPAISNMPQVEGWIDSIIAYINGINPNIVIFWMEPHAVAGLVSNPNVATGALSVAAYLNAKDAAGDICLVDWSSYADTDPSVYTNLTAGGNPYPADGVHIYGNEPVYFAQLLNMIESVEQTSNSPPSITISAPTNNSTLIFGTAVNLLATATDVEDGNLSSSIIWTSRLDGVIGSGSNLSITSLSLGRHTLSAEVTDSAGATTTAIITIILLLDSPQMLAPTGTLSTASPTFEWTAVNGATSYEIAIYNVGTNSVDFLSAYSATAAGCSTGATNCSVQPVTLAAGDYTWLVRAADGSHFSSWAVYP